MQVTLFISATTSEFGDYRKPLGEALTRPDVAVKIQDDFYVSDRPTLVKLVDYIRECDAVIHLVGDVCGADAPDVEVRALVAAHADLATKVPGLGALLADGAQPLTYTQWEAWLALYLDKPLFIAAPTAALKQELARPSDDDQRTRQRRHLDVLRANFGRHADIQFKSLDHLSALLLKSTVLDLLVHMALTRRQGVDSRLVTEILKQQGRSGMAPALFRHLWKEWGGREEQLLKLANAIKAQGIEDLAAAEADPHQASVLRAAWQRVELVQALYPLADRLGLSLSRWQDLARAVADHDARDAPERVGLHELLLWALDANKPKRALAALTLLLHQGARAAEQQQPAASRALMQRLETHTDLQPHVGAAGQFPAPSQGPMHLYVELDLSPDNQRPLLRRYWVQHQGLPVMGDKPPDAESLGEQLQILADAVENPQGRPLHVELLAPLLLLRASQAWMSYEEDIGAFGGLEGTTGRRDACEDLRLAWRWRDRLDVKAKAHTKTNAARWKAQAPLVTANARRCRHVSCRFQDKQAAAPASPVQQDADDTHLLGLTFVPPSPDGNRDHTDAFLAALRLGAPYMLWPSDEDLDCEAFKQGVSACIDKRDIDELPEAFRQGREQGQFKAIVLFMDDPDRNPYELMGRLTAPDTPSP